MLVRLDTLGTLLNVQYASVRWLYIYLLFYFSHPLSLFLRTYWFTGYLNALGRADFPSPASDELREHRCEGLSREVRIS